MKKGLIQAEEFGFHPEGGGSPGRSANTVSCFLILRKGVMVTRMKGPWVRVAVDEGTHGAAGAGQRVRKWPWGDNVVEGRHGKPVPSGS